MALFRTLQKYLAIDESLVDWGLSHFQRNANHPLFINTVGSWQYRPEVRPQRVASPSIPNLFLAGDYCRSGVDMPSVEGAIVTGELAAWQATDGKARLPRMITPGGLTPDAWMRLKPYLDPWLKVARKNGLPFSDAPRIPQAELSAPGNSMPISPATSLARPA